MKQAINTVTVTTKETTKGNANMSKATPKELTAEQKEQLEGLRQQILGLLTKNYELGKALIEVKALLAGTTVKFEPYCKKHFGLAHSQVNRLMNYAKTRDNIEVGDQNVYISENTLRGLSKYPAATQKKIWEEAVKLAGDKKIPTAAQVSDARKKVVPKDDLNPSDLKKQFHSRALDADVDLETEKPVDVIRKAENLAKTKAAIKEVIRRVELTPAEKDEICEFIKTKAAEEAMALMTPKTAEVKAENAAA